MSENKVTFGQYVDRKIAESRDDWSNPSWRNLLIVLPWTLGLILCLYWWNADRAISKREKSTLGTVTAHQPENHNSYIYVFSVNGRNYTGSDNSRPVEPKIGQQVVVYYDPLDPATNALTDFAELSTGALGPAPVLVGGIITVVLVIAYLRRKHRKRTP